jgi:hypothetical protein
VIPVRQVRAVYTPDTVTVYQAYNPELGSYAAANGRFPDTYNRGRMTWIKPSFLWMMYRSGWARKHRQERVLAIEISRSGFEWALANAALSHYQPDTHTSRQAWAASLRRAVRVQWDPERSLTMRPLEYRSLQVGLSGEAVDRYVDSWITGITDVTELAHSIHHLVHSGSLDEAAALLPKEQPYPLPLDIATPLRA